MPERWIWTAAPERDKFLHPCAAFIMGSHKVRMMSGPKTISQAQVMQRKISSGRHSGTRQGGAGIFCSPGDELPFRRIYLGFIQILHHMDSSVQLTTPFGSK